MIVIYHHRHQVVRVYDMQSDAAVPFAEKELTKLLLKSARDYPERLLVWCDQSLSEFINWNAFPEIFHHKKILASFNPSQHNFLPPAIGYVEESMFINVKKDVVYATWQMSAAVGGIHSRALALIDKKIAADSDFDYFLNSLGKLAMPLGLCCYSDPRLLIASAKIEQLEADSATLFSFVSQHFKTVWIFFLLLNILVYERRFPLFAAVAAIFYKRRKLHPATFRSVPAVSEIGMDKAALFDVVIPTIGRKKYLNDFLIDLAGQTLLPKKVIIVEQNPLAESESELDFLTSANWPFEIRHIFTHQAGACNARNLALAEVSGDWVFLADDDIRIGKNFLEQACRIMSEINSDVFNFCCINPGQTRKYDLMHQTSIFGGGCSIISRKSLGNSRFNTAFEFGFGEDSDFGMQLMNKGFGIEFIPEPIISHMKAPIGGFRTKPKLTWDNDPIKPKPAPTVLLFKLLHHTPQQINGYRTTLFVKYYGKQPVKNPISYYHLFNKQWNRSAFWANALKLKNVNRQ